MHAGDAWIEKLTMFISQRCILYRWSTVFQRCHCRRRLPSVHRWPPEAIFNMNTSWVQLRSSITIDVKDVCLTTSVSLWTRFSAIFFHTVTHKQLSDLTVRLHKTTSLKSISQQRWLCHQMFKRSSDQFNSLDVNHMTSHSSFSLVNRLTADAYCYDDHKQDLF